MQEQKIYAPMNGKEVVFRDGGGIVRLSCKAEAMMAFLKEHANEKGYVNLTLARRREAGKYGETHYVTLDTWKPQSRGDAAQPPVNTTKPESQDDDNIPF